MRFDQLIKARRLDASGLSPERIANILDLPLFMVLEGLGNG